MMGCLAQVAPEYSSIDMWEDVLGGLCACWLLPLALLGGVVLIANAIGVAWRDRGLERGAVYCSGCRFNLEGCASWNCPECGAHLDDGRVMTPGADRPLPLIPRVLLVAGAAVGPLVLAGVLLALVLPVNYEVNRKLVLRPVTEAMDNRSELTMQNYGESSGLGRGYPRTLYLSVRLGERNMRGRGVNDRVGLPISDSDDDVLSEELWARVVEQCAFDAETEAWRDVARAELVLTLRYMAGEFGRERPVLTLFQVEEHAHKNFEPNELIVLIEFLLGLAILGLIIHWTVRWHGRVVDVYVHRHARLAEKVNGWIGANREKAGLAKE